MSKPKLVYSLAPIGLALIVGLLFRDVFVQKGVAMKQRLRGQHTVEDRLTQFEASVKARLADDFAAIDVSYPPREMTLVGLKEEKQLEVWVSNPPKLLKTYPILAASGHAGPKLKEGDKQVPEGLYRIESLNPNSLYHLALRVNYPSPFDQKMGAADGRTDLGSDIMIHGNRVSIGCLAMGDEAAEELFVLAARTGVKNIRVILSPVDFRVRNLPAGAGQTPTWTTVLYEEIRAALEPLQ